jgi:hypothetical protein
MSARPAAPTAAPSTQPNLVHLLQRLTATPSQKPGEKRRANRVPLRGTLVGTPVIAGVPAMAMKVQLRDYSPRGVSVACPRELKAGDQLVLDFGTLGGKPAAKGATRILFRIVHVRPLEPQGCVAGCEIICTMAANQSTDPAVLAEQKRKAAALSKSIFND